MYAFQPASSSKATANWLNKGVQPILYSDEGGHEALWNTLEEWAIRARDTSTWYQKIVSMASKDPKELTSEERGQVAHVVSTLEGMKYFSSAEETPSADWLCVFDPSIRYSSPGESGSWYEPDRPFFDPFQAYGLDSDPTSNPAQPEP